MIFKFERENRGTFPGQVDIDLEARCKDGCTQYELDEEYRIMTCKHCGRSIEAFDYLVERAIKNKRLWLAEKESLAILRRRHIRRLEEYANLENKIKTLRNEIALEQEKLASLRGVSLVGTYNDK